MSMLGIWQGFVPSYVISLMVRPSEASSLVLSFEVFSMTVSIQRAYRFIAKAVYYDPWRILVFFCFRTEFGQDRILKLGVPCSFSLSSCRHLRLKSAITCHHFTDWEDQNWWEARYQEWFCDLLEENWKRSVKSLWGNYKQYKLVSGKLE